MSILSPALDFFSIGPTRSFSGISGYVTIQESTTDALEITQQPIQLGASIADHAFKKPVNLTIQMQFTEGSPLLNSTGLGLGGLGSLIGIGQSLRQIYESLLKLQVPDPPAVITPFTVSTLKRSYKNMLLVTLGLTTDKKTENVLAINASFQECIIVPIGRGDIPRSLLKTPALNLSTQNVGKKSALLSLAQGIGFTQ